MSFLEQFITFMNAGGSVMWVLFVLNLMLWYGLGYRYLILQRGMKGTVRRIIDKHFEKGHTKKRKGLIDYAVADAIEAYNEATAVNKKCRNYIDDALFPYRVMIGQYAVVVKTIVILAPLVGLLGTVMGMIETFDALQNSAMFGQGSSISGGISKALFTTELGLVVAVPGLIVGKVLDRKEDKFDLEFEQITDVLCTKDEL
ncbi:MAG: hypothetical protein KU28_05825 [Sulfurovum sp. PC08-66]|jgi:biopolymer transport protein ExbB|nr:MAG: hypothetical protein KU28_05825 [Sulfurovum sp. PC08-66]